MDANAQIYKTHAAKYDRIDSFDVFCEKAGFRKFKITIVSDSSIICKGLIKKISRRSLLPQLSKLLIREETESYATTWPRISKENIWQFIGSNGKVWIEISRKNDVFKERWLKDDSTENCLETYNLNDFTELKFDSDLYCPPSFGLALNNYINYFYYEKAGSNKISYTKKGSLITIEKFTNGKLTSNASLQKSYINEALNPVFIIKDSVWLCKNRTGELSTIKNYKNDEYEWTWTADSNTQVKAVYKIPDFYDFYRRYHSKNDNFENLLSYRFTILKGKTEMFTFGKGKNGLTSIKYFYNHFKDSTVAELPVYIVMKGQSLFCDFGGLSQVTKFDYQNASQMENQFKMNNISDVLEYLKYIISRPFDEKTNLSFMYFFNNSEKNQNGIFKMDQAKQGGNYLIKTQSNRILCSINGNYNAIELPRSIDFNGFTEAQLLIHVRKDDSLLLIGEKNGKRFALAMSKGNYILKNKFVQIVDSMDNSIPILPKSGILEMKSEINYNDFVNQSNKGNLFFYDSLGIEKDSVLDFEKNAYTLKSIRTKHRTILFEGDNLIIFENTKFDKLPNSFENADSFKYIEIQNNDFFAYRVKDKWGMASLKKIPFSFKYYDILLNPKNSIYFRTMLQFCAITIAPQFDKIDDHFAVKGENLNLIYLDNFGNLVVHSTGYKSSFFIAQKLRNRYRFNEDNGFYVLLYNYGDSVSCIYRIGNKLDSLLIFDYVLESNKYIPVGNAYKFRNLRNVPLKDLPWSSFSEQSTLDEIKLFMHSGKFIISADGQQLNPKRIDGGQIVHFQYNEFYRNFDFINLETEVLFGDTLLHFNDKAEITSKYILNLQNIKHIGQYPMRIDYLVGLNSNNTISIHNRKEFIFKNLNIYALKEEVDFLLLDTCKEKNKSTYLLFKECPVKKFHTPVQEVFRNGFQYYLVHYGDKEFQIINGELNILSPIIKGEPISVDGPNLIYHNLDTVYKLNCRSLKTDTMQYIETSENEDILRTRHGDIEIRALNDSFIFPAQFRNLSQRLFYLDRYALFYNNLGQNNFQLNKLRKVFFDIPTFWQTEMFKAQLLLPQPCLYVYPAVIKSDDREPIHMNNFEYRYPEYRFNDTFFYRKISSPFDYYYVDENYRSRLQVHSFGMDNVATFTVRNSKLSDIKTINCKLTDSGIYQFNIIHAFDTADFLRSFFKKIKDYDYYWKDSAYSWLKIYAKSYSEILTLSAVNRRKLLFELDRHLSINKWGVSIYLAPQYSISFKNDELKRNVRYNIIPTN